MIEYNNHKQIGAQAKVNISGDLLTVILAVGLFILLRVSLKKSLNLDLDLRVRFAEQKETRSEIQTTLSSDKGK